ncbi:MAG: DUF1684 domain-containing protein [bacterium]
MSNSSPSKRLARFLPLLWLLLLPAMAVAGNEYIQEIDDWHAQRVERLRSDTGWLTLVGLHPLAEGDNSVGSANGMDVQLIHKAPREVGRLTIHRGKAGLLVTLHLVEGIEVQVVDPVAVAAAAEAAARAAAENTTETTAAAEAAAARPTTIQGSLELIPDSAGRPTLVELGSLQFHVINRGDLMFLRVKDRQSEVLRDFEGIDRFPVDPAWRVTARLEVPDSALTVSIPNVLGQSDDQTSPGVLVFELAGQECRLTPIGDHGQDLFIIFGDETNEVTTYGGGRFLSASAPAEDGTVQLDFNQATNPPCVFTPYATCPLPPECNKLTVKVEAGEKMWGGHH